MDSQLEGLGVDHLIADLAHAVGGAELEHRAGSRARVYAPALRAARRLARVARRRAVLLAAGDDERRAVGDQPDLTQRAKAGRHRGR